MDLSRSLNSIARIFLKEPAESLGIYVDSNDGLKSERRLTISAHFTQWGTLRASGSSPSIEEAFFKALIELGEVIATKKSGLQNRNGIAGGFLASKALARAQAELIERDAFLFHYRSQTPFCAEIPLDEDLLEDYGSEVRVYEMASADSKNRCAIATDVRCANQTSECLWIGLGASEDIHEAARRALREYRFMLLDHRLRPGWCERVKRDPSSTNRLTDVHHSHSRDPRSLKRFAELCSNIRATDREQISQGRWKSKKLESVIRFVSYRCVLHPDLIPMEFGVPEPWSLRDSEGPLLHPFW
jgi:hypothetical protein